MEEFLQQIISQGPVGLVCACVVYCVIALQRNNTKKTRDTQYDDLDKRIVLLEHDNKLLHEQVTQIGNKLDKILETLSDIKVELAKKEDR